MFGRSKDPAAMKSIGVLSLGLSGFSGRMAMRFKDGGDPDPEKKPEGDPTKKAEGDPPAGTGETIPKKQFDDLSAQFRKTNKQLEDLQKAQKDREDAEKTELQKATERAEAAERKALEATRKAIGAKHGLPEQAWDRLKGATEEEIEADAASLKDIFKSGTQQPGHTGQDPNKQGKPPESKTKADELKAQMDEATKKGDISAALRIQRELGALKQ